MYSRVVGLSLAGIAAVVCATSLAGQGATRERQLVTPSRRPSAGANGFCS